MPRAGGARQVQRQFAVRLHSTGSLTGSPANQCAFQQDRYVRKAVPRRGSLDARVMPAHDTEFWKRLWNPATSAAPTSASRRWCWAAMCSAGTSIPKPPSLFSMPSSMRALTPSTPPTAIRAGRPAMSAANPKPSSASGSSTSGKRDKVVILTKFGEDMGEGRSTRKDYMQRAAAASLRRLQTDRIDLYQTHFDDEVTPVEETMAGLCRSSSPPARCGPPAPRT